MIYNLQNERGIISVHQIRSTIYFCQNLIQSCWISLIFVQFLLHHTSQVFTAEWGSSVNFSKLIFLSCLSVILPSSCCCYMSSQTHPHELMKRTSDHLRATAVLPASRLGALLARSRQHLGAQQESLHQSSFSKTNQKVPFSCLKEQTRLPRKRLEEQTRLLRNCCQRRSRLSKIPSPWDTSLG